MTTRPHEYRPDDFKDAHKGERVWLLGNGPSAREWTREDLAKLGGRIIGINRSWKPSDDGKFQGFQDTDYHCFVSGSHAYDVCAGKVRTGVVFLPEALRWVVQGSECDGHQPDRCFFRVLSGGYSPSAFRFDLDRGVMTKFAGYFSVQLAAWMGFSEIFLIGFDAGDRQGHAYDADPTKGRGTRDGHRRWFRGVADWANAKNARRPGCVRVLNCFEGSRIEFFERRSRDEVMEMLKT